MQWHMKPSLRVDGSDCLLCDTVLECTSISTEHSDRILKTTTLETPNVSACCLRINSDAMGLLSRQTACKPSQYSGCGRKVNERALTLAKLRRGNVCISLSFTDPSPKCLPHRSQTPSAHATDLFWVKAPENRLTKFLQASSKTGKLWVQAQYRLWLPGVRIASPAIPLVCENG